jgi:hypothetical protein
MCERTAMTRRDASPSRIAILLAAILVLHPSLSRADRDSADQLSTVSNSGCPKWFARLSRLEFQVNHQAAAKALGLREELLFPQSTTNIYYLSNYTPKS